MSTLIFLSRPEYSVVIDFAIAVTVDITATDDFGLTIASGKQTDLTITYAGSDIDAGSVGSIEEQDVRPAAKVSGSIATLPRLE